VPTALFQMRLTLPALLASCLLAGCGGASDSEPKAEETPTAPIKACDLLTFEEAKAIAGEPVAGLSSTLDDAVGRDPSQCVYNAGTLEAPRILGINVRRFPSARGAKRTFESSKSYLDNLGGGKLVEVPGLGDGAVWVGAKIQQLHVLRGDVVLVITSQGQPGKDLEAAKKIASQAVERMATGTGASR
jgi:hypothetical protein